MAPGIRPRILLALGVALLSLLLADPQLLAQDAISDTRASTTKPLAGEPPPGSGDQVETACGTISGSIACGDTINGTTVGAVNVMGSYSCNPAWNESGPEDVYSLTIPGGGSWQVHADFSGLPVADLDLFILGPAACNSSLCVAYGDNDAYLADAVGGATYYVVVDGYNGEAGEYELYVGCTAPDGVLEGHVLDMVAQGPPCTAANVHVEPGSLDLGVDPSTGQYGPVALAPGSYDLTATAADYPTSPLYVQGVVVAPGVTTTQDFTFPRADVAVTPSGFVGVVAVVGTPSTETLTIINNGYWAMDWELHESPYDYPWLAIGQTSGTIPELDYVDVDIYFDCQEEGDFSGELLLLETDPCNPVIYVPILLHCITGFPDIFADGFESGNTAAWSLTVP
jgi:hypothetical protein